MFQLFSATKDFKFSPDMLQNDNENQQNILIKKFYAECIIHFYIKFIAIANNIPMGCAEELKNSMVSTFNIERMPTVKFKVQKVHRFLNIQEVAELNPCIPTSAKIGIQDTEIHVCAIVL